MAQPVYAIGDVQGCGSCLDALLAQLPDVDQAQLWFAGDLVNRGPQSLETLRTVQQLGQRAHCVLGNHDLHLLAVVAGVRSPTRGDTFDAILDAPDRDDLVYWLRHCPLAVHASNHLMVHAGVHPQWTLAQTLQYADEVQRVLRSDRWTAFLADMYGNGPDQWDAALTGNSRLRVIVNVFTRMRMLDQQGRLNMKYKGGPADAPDELVAWYEYPNRTSLPVRVVFGHWSTLGLYTADNALGLDTGCVWGGRLSAVRLADNALYQVNCPAPN